MNLLNLILEHSDVIIASLTGLASLVAAAASYKQLTRTHSSLYIWICVALIASSFEFLLQVGAFILPASIDPNFQHIGLTLFSILLLIGIVAPFKYISESVAPYIISTFSSMIVAFIVGYLLLHEKIGIHIPLPQSTDAVFPLWEYTSLSFLALSLIAHIGLNWKRMKKHTLRIVSVVLFAVLTQYLVINPSTLVSTDIHLFRISLIFFYIVSAFIFLKTPKYKEDSTNPLRFSVRIQIALVTIPVVTLACILFLAPHSLGTNTTTDIGLLTLSIGIISGLLFSIVHRISRQFNILNVATTNIKSGSLEFDTGMYSEDEFGTLVTEFEDVVNSLKENSRSLQDKINMRTKDLAEHVKEIQTKNLALSGATTELEYAKNKVEQEKAQDEAILESIGEGVIVVDKSSRITLVNKKAIELLGFAAEELIKKKVTETLNLINEAGDVVGETKHPLTLALSIGEKTTSVNHFMETKDGTTFPTYTTITPTILNGKVTGAIQVFRDITIEKEVDRAKSEFVSLASHQLRTPLTTISWYSEALLAKKFGDLNDKQTSYLEEIYSGNKRMIELVNALLNVSRIELGAFIILPEQVNYVEFINGVLKELLPSFQEKDLALERNFPASDLMMNLDPNLMHIVVHNLLTNAIKYTPKKGKITLEVTKTNKEVILAVSDTGYGIPESEQDKIFSKLFRASNVSSLESIGTGLGLYIVKSVIEKGGGKVWFESKEDIGTTFFVSLPLYGMKKISGSKTLV